MGLQPRRLPALQLVTLLVLVYHVITLAWFTFTHSYGGAGLLYSRIVIGHSNGRLVAACSAARVARLPSGINGSVLWVHGSEWRILGGPALCDGMHVQGIGIVAANASSLVDAGGSLVAIHTALLPRGLEIYWSIEYIGPSGLLEQLAAIAAAVIAASWSARVRVSLASALLGATLYTLLAAALAAAIAIVMGDVPLYLIGVSKNTSLPSRHATLPSGNRRRRVLVKNRGRRDTSHIDISICGRYARPRRHQCLRGCARSQPH